MKPRLNPWWWLLLAALAVGAIGVGDRLLFGHTHVNYGSYVPWGLWVGVYIYFIGLSAGAFLLSSLVYVFRIKALEPIGRLALFTALVTLVAAVLSIWLDLGHMDRFYKIYTRPNFLSMMTWMVWLYTAYFLLLCAEFWLDLRGDLARLSNQPGWRGRTFGWFTLGQRDVSAESLARDRRRLRILGILGIPLAVAFHGGVGALFGVVGARPYWHSGMYPIMFLVSALASGGALLTFLVVFFGPDRGTEDHRRLVKLLGSITLGLLVFDLLLEWAEFSVSLYGAIPAHVEGFKLVIFGPYWWAFWIIHLGLGALAPLVLLTFFRDRPFWVGAATALIVGTFITVRLNIVIPGLAYPELRGLEAAYIEPGLGFQYFPSPFEWLTSLFVVGLGGLIFALGYRALPLFSEREAVVT